MLPDKDEIIFQCISTAIGAIFLFILLLFAFPKSCSAAEVFGEIGRSSYERPSGSLWQQEFAGYPTEWHTRPAMFRLGVEWKGIRLSYADLGKYKITATASDEENAVVACGCVVSYGDTDVYYTTGSIRTFILSYRARWKWLFLEAGPGVFRQSFKEDKDDGFHYEETLRGYGYMVGLGVEVKNISAGIYQYKTNIGARFGGGAYPAGTGGATVFSLGSKF